MAELGREEFLRMQRESQDRMKSMQRGFPTGARQNMPPTPGFVQVGKPDQHSQPAPPPPTSSPEPPPPQKRKGGSFDLLRMFNFKNLTMDSDRAVILAVLLLLCGDSDDELLMLALIYIML